MLPLKRAGALFGAFVILLALPIAAGRAQTPDLGPPSVPTNDDDEVRIAAVVNDQVISMGDVNARINLVIASASLPDTPANRQRIMPQVLRQMIDEKLEIEEAKKHDVKLSDTEIDQALKSLADQNHMSGPDLDKFLESHHIDKQTVRDQLTAQIVWGRAVRGRYGHSFSVSDDEINDAVKQIQMQRDQTQYRVAEIFLSVDSPSHDGEVKDLATRLEYEMSKGAPFPGIAQQFSQSATAKQGGLIGWVLPGMLDPEVEKMIVSMQPNQLTPPLRLNGGYYIYMLVEKRSPSEARDVVANLTQVVFPLADNADAKTKQETVDRATKATAEARSCGEMAKLGRDISPDLSGPIGDVHVKEMPADLRPVILAAEVAVPTKPVPVHGGIGVFMVCKKEGGDEVDRDLVGDNLLHQRLDNLARRYLSDLRLIAYVDMRV
ncbi:MAG TPA: peptidylprolyl isomerase [Aliidongia sp.]|nr:peptidylprolyl isomerase [Aliidongia sp.]